MNVIFFFFLTNGLTKHHSVLSISAIKCSFQNGAKNTLQIIERYERFYFRKPGEELGVKAIEVNGLTDDIIKKQRKNVKYPKNFCSDIDAYNMFCADTRHFVGHNISYDKQYIDFSLANTFCTMKENTKILGLKRKNGGLKFPSLKEAAKFYGVKTDEKELHGSMYDSFITYQIFSKMLENKKAKPAITAFLNTE